MTIENHAYIWLDHCVGELVLCESDLYGSSVSPEYYFYVFADRSIIIGSGLISVMTATFGFGEDVAINIAQTWLEHKLIHQPITP